MKQSTAVLPKAHRGGGGEQHGAQLPPQALGVESQGRAVVEGGIAPLILPIMSFRSAISLG